MVEKRIRYLDAHDIRREQEVYERQFSMTSDEFWDRYFGGELDGSPDFVRWIGLCRMAKAVAASRPAKIG